MEHSPKPTVKQELLAVIPFLLAFVGLVSIVVIPAILRPAAPKTAAETIAIIAPETAPVAK